MQNGVILAAQPYGLGLNETLMPQYLKELGYATHGVGKVQQFFLLLKKYGDQRQLESNRFQVNLYCKAIKLNLSDYSGEWCDNKPFTGAPYRNQQQWLLAVLITESYFN